MDLYLRIVTAVILGVVVSLILNKNGTDMSIMVTVTVSAMVLLSSVTFLEPIIDFCKRLQIVGNLDGQILEILLKAAGIGIVSHICSLLCEDAGNHTLGKTLQLVGTSVIVWLSLPLLEKMITLIDAVLGAV